MQDQPFLYTPDAEERQRWGFTKPSDHRVLVIPSGRHVGVYAVGVDAVAYFQRESAAGSRLRAATALVSSKSAERVAGEVTARGLANRE